MLRKDSRMKKTILLILFFTLSTTTKIVKADFVFGTPTNSGSPLNTNINEVAPCISADSLEIYFSERDHGPYRSIAQRSDIRVSRRQTKDDRWGFSVNLGTVVNSTADDLHPSISADGLSLYFSSNRAGGSGLFDLWLTTRETKDSPWGNPVNLGSTLNSSGRDICPCISPDGLELYFSSNRDDSTVWKIWVAKRQTTDDPWGTPVSLGSNINSGSESWPNLVFNGLMLFFSSDRSGGYGSSDIWFTTRETTDGPWAEPRNLGPAINSSHAENGSTLSHNGSIFYFSSNRLAATVEYDIWQVPIEPIVDLNGDGVVDSGDMCTIVDYWQTDNSLCDIGSTPLGDGIVDVQDLIVLSEYLFTTIDDPTLVAHWALDETQGMFAIDSVGNNDALIVGDAVWQAGNGYVDGALQLNGVDSCAITNPVLNPTDGPFSVIAWVRADVPGQVIISQQSMANWLAADGEGNLMTELKSSDQLAGPLHSETTITDGQWHRIGLVWDGSHRTLYVDGVSVAEDTQPGLESSQMGLYIGVDKNFTPGTFFSGLIDDVRIYNRVVSP
jgi:hypothetical protein